jgi:hypothetical protein
MASVSFSGIDPLELQFHPLASYKFTGDSEEIAKIRFDKCEAVRQASAAIPHDCRPLHLSNFQHVHNGINYPH